MDQQEKTETKTDLAAKKQKAADQDLPKEKRRLDKASIVNLTEADNKYLDEMNYGTPEETFP